MEHLQIELPERYKNVIKDATIEIVDGNIIITPKKQEFKDGDILFTKDDEFGIICIIYRHDNEKGTGYYCSFSSIYGLEIDMQHWEHSIKFNIASDKEKQKLFDALDKACKRWNPETKQIEDILKVGDLAIFWEKDKSKAIIAKLLEYHPENTSPDKMHKCYNQLWYSNVIKFKSIEQYINFIK